MITIGKNIIVKNEIESTNNYAKQMVSDKPEEGTVVLAQYQQFGRGQQGNSWESEPGKNLLFSIILYPSFLSAGMLFYLSKIISLALFEYLNDEVADVKIKWPNDIYVGGKKVAGILIENAVNGNHLDYSIAGIGLNLNQTKFFSDAPNPVSLKQLKGVELNKEEQLKKLLKTIEKWYAILLSKQFEKIDSAYLKNLYAFMQWRKYRVSNKELNGRINGVGEFGQLQLELQGGEKKEFMFKEIELVFEN